MIRLTWKISILNVYWFSQSTERKDICLRHQKLACEMIKNLNYSLYLYCQLTLFTPLTSFDTPWKHQKTRVFLMFSGGIKRNQWHEKPGLPHRHKIIKCHQKVKFRIFVIKCHKNWSNVIDVINFYKKSDWSELIGSSASCIIRPNKYNKENITIA